MQTQKVLEGLILTISSITVAKDTRIPAADRKIPRHTELPRDFLFNLKSSCSIKKPALPHFAEHPDKIIRLTEARYNKMLRQP